MKSQSLDEMQRMFWPVSMMPICRRDGGRLRRRDRLALRSSPDKSEATTPVPTPIPLSENPRGGSQGWPAPAACVEESDNESRSERRARAGEPARRFEEVYG